MPPTNTAPLLHEVIRIRQNGVRSVNIEADLNNPISADGYVLTTQVRVCLGRLLRCFDERASARAWTLTGPYGSGKSYFSLFLMRLLGKTQSHHRPALHQLEREDEPLAGRFKKVLDQGGTEGLFAIPVTCYRASIAECLKHGLTTALGSFKRPASIKALRVEAAQWTAATDSRTIVQWFRRLLPALHDQGYLGALLVFDELGKSLEFSAAHSEGADIYLLQELAEQANRSGVTPLILIGVLHQAFEHYAALLDLKTQQEWAKIQGRFEDIAFQEPPAQQIRLLAKAIEADGRRLRPVQTEMQAAANVAFKDKWFPPTMKQPEVLELARQAYPLHPTALVALPYLFRRLAQNERSLFAYLASHEPAGFQEFLHQHHLGDFIGLPELFDYLVANFQGRLFATGRARLIAETLERLESAPNLEPQEIRVIKTLGLLGWLAEVGGSHLLADESRVISALRFEAFPEAAIRQTLLKLQTQSLIVYRRFNDTYAVWQGSDVDLEVQLRLARQKTTEAFSLADTVQSYLPPRPIVARRHSYQTGTLRYFEVRYADSFNHAQMSLDLAPGANGLVLLCLPQNASETKTLAAWAQATASADRPHLVIGLAEQSGRWHELLYELRCLYWVRDNTPELRDDPVARRELRARLTTVETLILSELTRALSPARLTSARHQWFQGGQTVSALAQRGLSHLLSTVCDRLYAQSPVVWNEIVNRRALSSQGAAARRNLIEAMLQRAAVERLGITGFPPELSMYESLLKASGLHCEKTPQAWAFGAPPSTTDPLKLEAVWQALSAYVFTDPPTPRSVATLFEQLKAPPYGLTDGVLPVWLCAFLIAYQGETTLYRENSLLPEPNIADWEVLLRRPELFAVAGCRVTGTRAAIVERFARSLRVEPTVMPVVRSLVRMLGGLSEYATQTQRLSPTTVAVRTAIKQARSPERLLFHDLPQAFAMEPLEPNYPSPEQLTSFFTQLNAAFRELDQALPRVLAESRTRFLTACGLATDDAAWENFRAQATQMKDRVVPPALTPLLKRAAETLDSQAALESVLAYMTDRPPRTWTDLDVERFAMQANHYGKLFQQEYRGYAPGNGLSPEQRQRSQTLAQRLRQSLHTAQAEDPQVIQAALHALLQEYQLKIAG